MNLVERAKNVILMPNTELPAFAAEPATVASLYQQYIMPLAAIPAIAGFIGRSIVGTSMFGVTFRQPIVSGIVTAIVGYVLGLAAIYIFALIINALAPSFGATPNPVASLKAAAVCATPAWILGILTIFPPLAILGILGLYGLYLLYLALPIFMRAPADKAAGYTIVSLLAGIVLAVILGVVLAVLIKVLPGGSRMLGYAGETDTAAAGLAIASTMVRR